MCVLRTKSMFEYEFSILRDLTVTYCILLDVPNTYYKTKFVYSIEVENIVK